MSIGREAKLIKIPSRAILLVIGLLCSFATCNAVCLAFADSAPAAPAQHGPAPYQEHQLAALRGGAGQPRRSAGAGAVQPGDVTNAPGVLGSGVARLQRSTPQDVVPSVTVDFGKVVVGYPKISFAGSSGNNNPGVRLAFSESIQYLTDRSDFTRSDYFGGLGTDKRAKAGEKQFATHVRPARDSPHYEIRAANQIAVTRPRVVRDSWRG